MSKSPEESQWILQNPTESQRILKNLKESWRTSKNGEESSVVSETELRRDATRLDGTWRDSSRREASCAWNVDRPAPGARQHDGRKTRQQSKANKNLRPRKTILACRLTTINGRQFIGRRGPSRQSRGKSAHQRQESFAGSAGIFCLVHLSFASLPLVKRISLESLVTDPNSNHKVQGLENRPRIAIECLQSNSGTLKESLEDTQECTRIRPWRSSRNNVGFFKDPLSCNRRQSTLNPRQESL